MNVLGRRVLTVRHRKRLQHSALNFGGVNHPAHLLRAPPKLRMDKRKICNRADSWRRLRLQLVAS